MLIDFLSKDRILLPGRIAKPYSISASSFGLIDRIVSPFQQAISAIVVL